MPLFREFRARARGEQERRAVGCPTGGFGASYLAGVCGSLARACICRTGCPHQSAPLSSSTGSRLFLHCNPRGLDRRSSLGSSESPTVNELLSLGPRVIRGVVLELSEKRLERASSVILGRLQNMLRSRLLVNTALGRGRRRALGSQ